MRYDYPKLMALGVTTMRAITVSFAAVVLAVGGVAQAGTPQQDLRAHMAQQAGKSVECPRLPASNEYCNPKPVGGTAKDAMAALKAMRLIETLGVMCSGGDTSACLRQGAYRDQIGKLGWCAQPTMGRSGENVIVWGRCSKSIVINRAD